MKKFLTFTLFGIFLSGLLFGQYSEEFRKAHKTGAIKRDSGLSVANRYVNPLHRVLKINADDCSFEEILTEITDQCGIYFVYESKIGKRGGYSLDLERGTVKDVLDDLCADTDLTYVVLDRDKIVVTDKNVSDKKTGKVKGIIRDDSGEILIGANVLIKENNFGSASDETGFYEIKNLKPGVYTIRASFVGFKSKETKVTIVAGRALELDFILEAEGFMVGGIEVVADNELMPVDPQTKTKINAGEIEHLQASSLKDVMSLAPGTKTTNPTLDNTEKATIRGGDAIGTQVVMDGVPISNNTNMQVGMGYSTVNSGIDLRAIPAENIEEVEIIRGIPSVEYGDLTDGLMIVKTKAKASPLRFKAKYNPNVYEMNLNGGFAAGDWVFNLNGNLASSGRDVRVEGDGYTRFAGQVNILYQKDNYEIKNGLFVTRTIDEKKEEPGYVLKEAWFNKDWNIKYNGAFEYNVSDLNKLSAKYSVSYTKRNSYSQQMISRDNTIISDLTENGSREGYIVYGSYLGKKWIKGNEWNIYGDLNYKFKFFTGDYIHSWVAGATYRNEFNNGKGILFDPLFPPMLSSTSPRLRSYDDLPGYTTLSFYLEDKIAGRLLVPFTLQFGARYEVYRPDEFNFSGLWGDGEFINGKNGSFLNPRISFSANIFEDTQIRLSYGVTTKSPPMSMIFAQDRYFDVVDTASIKDATKPEENFSIISTYKHKVANENLKAYKQYKYEASIDQQIGDIGLTLTGYYNKSEDMFSSSNTPIVKYKKSFPDWPNHDIYSVYDTLLDSYYSYTNNGYRNVKGLEFALKTKKIPVINTIFKFDASYMEQESGTNGGYRTASRRFVKELGMEVVPFQNDIEIYRKDLLLNYRFDIQSKSLGMWVTLHIQQQLLEIDGKNNLDDSLAVGYFGKDGNMVWIAEKDRASEKYKGLRDVKEDYEYREEDRPNLWLVNIKVSKELWKGAAVSFFVNNFFNNHPIYEIKRSSDKVYNFQRRNPDIFYGLEFHTSL